MGKRGRREKPSGAGGWLAAFALVVMADNAAAFDFSAERIVKRGSPW